MVSRLPATGTLVPGAAKYSCVLQDLWMRWLQATSVSCDSSDSFGWCDVDGSLEESPLVEDGAVAYQCDQMWRVDFSPAGLCGFDQLVGHRHAGRARPWGRGR